MTIFWWWCSLWIIDCWALRSAALSVASSPISRPIRICYAGLQSRHAAYRAALLPACTAAGLTSVQLSQHDARVDPSLYDYLLYHPNAENPVQNWDAWMNLRAIFSLRAGVEGVLSLATVGGDADDRQRVTPPRRIPMTRMVDPGLREGMVEYVVGHVLRYHLNTDQHWYYSNAGQWNRPGVTSALARQRIVGILGVGVLGGACAEALAALNFQVVAWSRRARKHDNDGCSINNKIRYCHGRDGLYQDVLPKCDFLVLLLPSTSETLHLFNKDTFRLCKPGVQIINGGRGDVLDDADLLQALDMGLVAAATLDVFEEEPLPADHPFWQCHNILITPHIAAKSQPETAVTVIAENIRRAESGEPLVYQVDPEAGY